MKDPWTLEFFHRHQIQQYDNCWWYVVSFYVGYILVQTWLWKNPASSYIALLRDVLRGAPAPATITANYTPLPSVAVHRLCQWTHFQLLLANATHVPITTIVLQLFMKQEMLLLYHPPIALKVLRKIDYFVEQMLSSKRFWPLQVYGVVLYKALSHLYFHTLSHVRSYALSFSVKYNISPHHYM